MLRQSRSLAITASLVGFSCLLLSCGQAADSQSTVAEVPVRDTPGQVLPITAKATLANQVFELEVAQKPQQQEIGLMYRTFLPPNRGMLFPFEPAQPVQFWMKHCKISLDMIFLRQGRIIAISAKTPPCKTDPCPQYGPDEPIDQVIEIQSGRAADMGLNVGATVEVQWLKP